MHEGTQQSSSSGGVSMSLWLTIGLQVAWQGVQNILTGRVVLCKGQVHPPYRRRLPSAPPRIPGRRPLLPHQRHQRPLDRAGSRLRQ